MMQPQQNTPPRPQMHRGNPAVVSQPATPAPDAPPPMSEAKFSQDDPALQANVAEFIASASGSAPAADRVEIKPDDTLSMPNPNDLMMSEALVNTEAVEISDEEKSLFVKALLNDVPVKLKIELYGGQFNVLIRSRSSFEHRRILDVVDHDIVSGLIPKADIALTITRMHQYCQAIMIERVNGTLFSDLTIPYGTSVEAAAAMLHEAIEPRIERVTGIRWTALQNAMRIFESKCAKLGTEAANQDFWKPRG